MRYKRIFTVVIDSLGVGAMPDADAYGDKGTDTLGHISDSVEAFSIPNLVHLGIAELHQLKQISPCSSPMGCFCKAQRSKQRQGYYDRPLGNDGTSY